MSIVEVYRQEGDEPTEIEEYLKVVLETAVWRRPGWQEKVSGRLVHVLGLINQPMKQASISGGSFRVVLTARAFSECATCSKKPGAPILCDACLKNRAEALSGPQSS